MCTVYTVHTQIKAHNYASCFFSATKQLYWLFLVEWLFLWRSLEVPAVVIPKRTRTAGNGGAGLLRQLVGGRKRNVDHRGYPSAGPGVVAG